MKKFFIAALLTVTVATSSAVSAQERGPAERQARAFIEVISTGDLMKVRSFVEANCSAKLAANMEQVLGSAAAHYSNSRGYEVVNAYDANADSATLLLKNKLTGFYDAMIVYTDSTAPFRIKGFAGRTPKSPPVAAAGKTLSNAAIGKELESYMNRLAEADAFSGVILLAKDGVPVYKGVYGTANKDYDVPNRIDTKFSLGSMNKMFTAISIAQLVEKGKLSFDDSLSKFIPDFPDAESAKKIKIKHLLSHTAGLGTPFNKRYWDVARTKFRTVDDMMSFAKQDEKLLFEPGTKHQYSNTGMLVLGKVIEIVSGQSYYDYVRENIYKPAGMMNSDHFELDKPTPNHAVGYQKSYTSKGINWSNNVFTNAVRGGPMGGGFSTVDDLLRFDQAFRSGKLVSAEMVKLLTSPKPDLKSPNYGYGFIANTNSGYAGHNGIATGVSTNMLMYLNSGWTAIVLSNYNNGSVTAMQKMQGLIKQSETK
jgi:CubicO group peptidase (beta-lactamase class C family)